MLSDAACARDAQKIFRPLSSIAAPIDGPISKTSRARKQQLTATPPTDEYDAAQDRGEIAGHGGGKSNLGKPKVKKLGCPTINCTKRGRSGTPKRLTDEYDAAQERGEVRSNGERSFSEGEKVGFADLGLTGKDIHEARRGKG